MKRFQNKYRIASARAQWWDYGWNGAYYITICTHDREHYFGEIVDKKMNLSKTGVIADILWNTMRQHHKFVELGDFVVMPNHIYGILILDKPDGGLPMQPPKTLKWRPYHQNQIRFPPLFVPTNPP